VFISKKHAKVLARSEGPGPVYNIPDPLGKEGCKPAFGTGPQRVSVKRVVVDSALDLSDAPVDAAKFRYPSVKGVPFGTDPKDNMKNSVITRSENIFFPTQ
jgi:hypothetical protein